MSSIPSLRDAGCAKPGCNSPSGRSLERHHKRHQAMWLGIWASRRHGETKWNQFVDRYWQFHEEDIVKLCDHHHAEIHLIYDKLIKSDRLKLDRSLAKYTWTQAETLMDKLEETCDEWLEKETPGIEPRELIRLRQ